MDLTEIIKESEQRRRRKETSLIGKNQND